MTSASSQPGPAAPTAEQRRQAALHFDRGGQLVATGSYLAGIHLLIDCCRLDPANLLYRQALRRAEKARFGNDLKGGRLAWLFSWPHRARLRAARSAGRYLDVLHLGERVLVHNPWDVPVQLEMASAAEALGLLDLAVWNLEQARHKEPNSPELNRRLARLYERRGNFTQALAVWELVQKAAPHDEEARQKLAVSPAGAPALPGGDIFESQVRAARTRVEEEPTRPGPYLELARLYRQMGRPDEARAALAEGLPATGNAFDLTVELLELEIDPFRRDLVLTREKLAGRPDDPDLRRIEQALAREVNTRELELYRLLADRFPGRLVYRYEVGLRLLEAGQLAEALEEIQAVRGDAELRGPALLALARGFRGRQHLRQAQRHYEEALASLPPEQGERRHEVLYELARCHAELGDLPRAVELASELVRAAGPAHRDIAQLLADWQARSRQAS
jgi:tetratricopeptide (TPR) repeat protein